MRDQTTLRTLTGTRAMRHSARAVETATAGCGSPNNTGGHAATRAAFFMSDCARARLPYGVRARGSLRAGRFLCSGLPHPAFRSPPHVEVGWRIKPPTQEAIMPSFTRTSAHSRASHRPVRLSLVASRCSDAAPPYVDFAPLASFAEVEAFDRDYERRWGASRLVAFGLLTKSREQIEAFAAEHGATAMADMLKRVATYQEHLQEGAAAAQLCVDRLAAVLAGQGGAA